MAHATLTRTAAQGRPSGSETPTRVLSAVPAIIKAPPPLLELQIHLLNGTTRTFIQNDPQAVRQILRHLGPRLFSQPVLILQGPDQLLTFPGSALMGLSILMDPIPAELTAAEPFPCFEITQEEYQAERRVAAPMVEGQPFLMFCEVEMISGRRLWFAGQVPEEMYGFQERRMMHKAFSLPSLLCRRLGGGLSLWNRAQMVSCSFCPIVDGPESAWPIEPF